MDDQHRLILGYRDLEQHEIDDINDIKEYGEQLQAMLGDLAARDEYDQRWVSIARTHFQQGLMAAVRAVARPTTF
jgi:hypothetical protein